MQIKEDSLSNFFEKPPEIDVPPCIRHWSAKDIHCSLHYDCSCTFDYSTDVSLTRANLKPSHKLQYIFACSKDNNRLEGSWTQKYRFWSLNHMPISTYLLPIWGKYNIISYYLSHVKYIKISEGKTIYVKLLLRYTYKYLQICIRMTSQFQIYCFCSFQFFPSKSSPSIRSRSSGVYLMYLWGFFPLSIIGLKHKCGHSES